MSKSDCENDRRLLDGAVDARELMDKVQKLERLVREDKAALKQMIDDRMGTYLVRLHLMATTIKYLDNTLTKQCPIRGPHIVNPKNTIDGAN